MGACMSTTSEEQEQKKKSQAIDKQLEEDSKRLRRECKILLLGMSLRRDSNSGHGWRSWDQRADHHCVGSGESGKSTIVKQMKIIHLQGYTEDELYNYRPTVFKNLVECAKAVIAAMRQFELEPFIEENREYANFLTEYTPESGPQAHINPQVGLAVQSLWNDPVKEQLMERQTEFYLMDSAE
jgi:guanine nucleotide-binding protein G(i) subunit alpha